MRAEQVESVEMRAMVSELQELATSVRESTRALFLRASEFENKHAKLWKQFHATFDDLLRQYNICDVTSYRNFLAASGIPDVLKASEEIGMAATIEAGKIQDKSRRTKYIEAAIERRKDKGLPWSTQEAKTMRLKIAGSDPQDSAFNRRVTNRLEQQNEIVTLKRQLHKLERENAELRAENEKLVAKLKMKKA